MSNTQAPRGTKPTLYVQLTPGRAMALATKLMEEAKRVQEANAKGNLAAYCYVGDDNLRIRISENTD